MLGFIAVGLRSGHRRRRLNFLLAPLIPSFQFLSLSVLTLLSTRRLGLLERDFQHAVVRAVGDGCAWSRGGIRQLGRRWRRRRSRRNLFHGLATLEILDGRRLVGVWFGGLGLLDFFVAFGDGRDEGSDGRSVLVPPCCRACANSHDAVAFFDGSGVLVVVVDDARRSDGWAERGTVVGGLFAARFVVLVAFHALGFLGDGVVVFGNEVVDVADGFVEDVQTLVAFDGPEDVAVLEPGVREHAVHAPEDVGQVSDALLVAAGGLAAEGQSAREVFLRGEDVGGPVEGVAAVVDCAAGFRGIVHGAEVLPFRRSHLGAVEGGAGRRVGEEADDEVVDFLHQEAAEFVEPEGAVHVVGCGGEHEGGLAADGDRGVVLLGFGGVEVECFEVFLQLERRVELWCSRSGPWRHGTWIVYNHTSESGTNGGPEAISAAFVPGRILRVAPLSSMVASSMSWMAELPIAPGTGDFGPI